MEEENYKDFFENIKRFKHKQHQQKQRGLNDYNLLTTVLKPHDEVRLHSRMIGSLLDINGSHYQDGLFLEIFIEVVFGQDFVFDIQNSQIHLEQDHIDLYITDGSKHIIIENKIYAKDQKSQIKRYIKTICEANEDLNDDEIYVIYLSLHRKKPSDYSLGKIKDNNKEHFEIRDDKLVYKGDDRLLKDRKINYRSIHYKNEILQWLEKSYAEISNIVNLSEVLRQYIDVVKILNKSYKGKVMTLLEFIGNIEDSDRQKNYIQILNEIEESYSSSKREYKVNFFIKSLVEYLNNNLKDGWKVKLDGDKKKIDKKFRVNIQFYKDEDWKVVYWLRFNKDNMKGMYWAIAKKEKNIDITKAEKLLKDKGFKDKKTSTSLWWNFSEGDLEKNILLLITGKEEELSKIIFKEFYNVIKGLEVEYELTLDKINKIIGYKDSK